MPRGSRSKSSLRSALLAARRARGSADLTAARAAIRSVVLAHVRAAGWRRVACYEPLRTEPGSAELLAALPSVLVPVLLPDKDLAWREWPSGPQLPPEAITDVEAVFVPALAVDRWGTRLGRGGGSYDRALARVGPGVPVVALVFEDEFVAEPLPRDRWDVPVNAVVTPSGWHPLDAE